MFGKKYSIVLLVVLFLAPVFLLEKPKAANVTIRCKARERRALLDFKKSLAAVNGTEFGASSWGSWYEEKDCCKWDGVRCNDSTGHVVDLDLDNRIGSVTGTISSALLELRYLSSLSLFWINFNGSSIPEFIGFFSELTHLNLSYCFFGGPIPSHLGNLSRLIHLDLSKNQLKGSIPSHLGNISSLVHLDLSDNWLKGLIPSQLGKLSRLVHLDLSSNLLKGSIPSQLGNLSRLVYLDLSYNQLTGSIPSQLGNLSRLVHLSLHYNHLKGSIPSQLGNLSGLVHLSLSFNQLTGSVPESLWNICSLLVLDLESNNLGGDFFGILQSTSNLCATYSLEYLALAHNQFTGSVPDEIAKLPSLMDLSLEYNRLNGSISPNIGQLSNLRTFSLGGNSFDGVVISEAYFSNSSNLKKLDLSETSLALKFSPDWVPPFQLEIILLRSCKLGPSFPHWIGSQNFTYEIDISASGVSDSIPSYFWNITLRTSLNFSSNQISGHLPTNFNFTPDDLMSTAHFIDLSFNNLTGLLPKFPTFWSFIKLSNNKLFGSITSICENSNEIVSLDLSNNLFSGEVPNCFAEWEYLQVLNLAENKFSGLVPMSIGSASSLEMLSLRSNSLSGPLPASLQNCSKLRFMDLSDNKMSGNIPKWIGQSFSRLVFLSLGKNHFIGSIPHQLCELSNLQILDLSLNRICGTIPLCLSNFTSMAQHVNLNRTIEQSISYRSLYYGLSYVYGAVLRWKGQKQRYAKILGLLLVIDLSSNQLSGGIPDELTSLRELVGLNLSRNFLTGKIPRNIGQLGQLQTLDLSRNKLSGSIPPALTEITFLSTLDLSYNCLSGEIPKGTQLQSFDPSAFSHNHGLCGSPISPNCSGPLEPPQGQPGSDKDESDEFMKWFYVGSGLGFAAGFWGFCGAVFFKRSWRHSYFRFLDNLKDRLYLAFALRKARLERRVQA